MKQTKNKYFYDDGFGYKAYICPNCGGRQLARQSQGGFSPPQYRCTSCELTFMSPVWEKITDEEKKELGIVDDLLSPHTEMSLRKYQINLEENNRIIKEVEAELTPKVEKAINDKDLEKLKSLYDIIAPLPIGLSVIAWDNIILLSK